jgi:K+-sensing histidine kinase KdpD
MNFINGIYLGIGIGLGLGLQSFWNRSKQPSNPSSVAPLPENKQDNTEELAALTEQIQQMQLAYHMAEEMSQFQAGFLARTSHELRSPLNSLIGMHQLILSDLCENSEEEREFVAQANQSALKLINIIDEILNVSRTEYGKNPLAIQPLQLAVILDELHQLTHMLAENRNFRLRLSPPDSEIYILADPDWLRQVLVSLVNMTIIQMEEGSIYIFTQAVPEANLVHIWLDVPLSASTWSEPIDLMYSNYASPQSLNGDSTTSPGMKLLLNQTLLKAMQGKLEIIAIPTDEQSAENLSRIQISIPLLTLETPFPHLEDTPG